MTITELDTDEILRNHSKAWEGPSADELARRQQLALDEWAAMIEEGDLHDAAMWLQSDGYRLQDLYKDACDEWTALSNAASDAVYRAAGMVPPCR